MTSGKRVSLGMGLSTASAIKAALAQATVLATPIEPPPSEPLDLLTRHGMDLKITDRGVVVEVFGYPRVSASFYARRDKMDHRAARQIVDEAIREMDRRITKTREAQARKGLI